MLLLVLAGCPTVQPARVTQFQQAADSAHTQAQATFNAINALITEDEINLVITKDKLQESDVQVILSQSDIAKWDKAFSAVDNYCKSLQALLDANLSSDVQTSIVGAADQLKNLDKNAVPDPVISTAFTEVAGLFTQAKAQSDAMKIAKQADPNMQVIFQAMASAIGSDASGATVWHTASEHWVDRMGKVEDAFHRNYDEFQKVHATTPPSSDEQAAFAAKQRLVVQNYIQLRDLRDAQLQALSSLQQSLLGLAEAHSALARGSASDLSTVLSSLQADLDNAKSLYDKFKALSTGKAATNG